MAKCLSQRMVVNVIWISGSYERFLNQDIPKSHNITTAQIYSSVIDAERKGKYLGACVQIIPHITDEIKNRIRAIADDEAA